MDKRPPRISREENARRIAALLPQTSEGWDKTSGDMLVIHYLLGDINEIPGTSWKRAYGECAGEDASFC